MYSFDAFQQMDKALLVIRGQGSATPIAQRRGAENRYGQGYAQLVKMGVRPQLRLKYRLGR